MNTRTLPSALLVGASFAAGCQPGFELPASALVRCERPADCPSGWTCKATLGHCVKDATSDTQAPSLVDGPEVEPSRIAADGQVRVSFTVTEPLAEPPAVTLDPEGLGRLLTVEAGASGANELFWVATYEVVADEPEATVVFSFHCIDLDGNVGTVTAGNLTFDFTPPTITGLAWTDAGFASNSDALSAQAEVTAPAVVVTANLRNQDGRVLAPLLATVAATTDVARLDLLASIDLATVALEGSSQLQAYVEVADDVGNMATAESDPVSLDPTPPETEIDSGPSGETLALDAVVSFSSPSADAVAFDCRIDNGLFEPCTSPVALADLTIGVHEVAVRAWDAAGNVDDSPALATWTVTHLWTAIAAGGAASCGITTADRLWCWGHNVYGALGRGDGHAAGLEQTPVMVPGRYRALSLGKSFGCAIALDNTLWCWGRNEVGQLGLGYSGGARPEPVRVTEHSDWVAIAAGTNHVCGIRDEEGVGRTLWCWGSNVAAQLAQSPDFAYERTRPARVGTGVDWLMAAVGGWSTCGIRGAGPAGTLYCWGDYVVVPTPVDGASDWIDTGVNMTARCGLRDSGSLWCWGNNDDALLASPADSSQNLAPAEVATGMSTLAVGSSTACAIGTDGALFCWGRNDVGEAGLGAPSEPFHPAGRVGTEDSWETVSLGFGKGCALRNNGTAACWGDLLSGSVDAAMVSATATAPVVLPGTWSDVEVADEHACALDAARAMWCWGKSVKANIATAGPPDYLYDLMMIGGPAADHPTRVTFDGFVEPVAWLDQAAYGKVHCGIRDDGGSTTLWCWGIDDGGRLGRGNTLLAAEIGEVLIDSGIPAPATDWVQVDVSANAGCGLRAESATETTLWCWGADLYDKLGNGPGRTDSPYAQQVEAETDWTDVSVGAYHACGLRDQGDGLTLWCWGQEYSAADCVIDGVHVATPTLVGAAADRWLSVAAGQGAACAVRDDKTLWCWGDVPGAPGNVCPMEQQPGDGWLSVDVGYGRACGVADRNGERAPWCFGSNAREVLSDASAGFDLATPVRIGSDDDWLFIRVNEATSASMLLCGLRDNGRMSCWGDYREGRVGDDRAWRDSPEERALP